MLRCGVPNHSVALSDLLLEGLLNESTDFLHNGKVKDDARARAAEVYRELHPKEEPSPARRPPPSPRKPKPTTIVRSAADAETTACIICLQSKRSIAFVPCYHVIACSTCGSRVNACPMCRAPIDREQRVYL